MQWTEVRRFDVYTHGSYRHQQYHLFLEEDMTDEVGVKPKSLRRGFAGMDPDRRRELARKGGRACPNEKRPFAADHDLAVAAAQKGGASRPADQRAFARDHELAVAASLKGVRARRGESE